MKRAPLPADHVAAPAREPTALALGLGVVAVLLIMAFSPSPAAGQTGQMAAPTTMRAYWHVFVAYALAWVLVFGWLVSVARRLARVERSLER